MDYRGRRVTIMGLGHFGGGVAAARWLARQGAIVTVTDMADENALADSLASLADMPIAAMHLGRHCEEDFQDADLVVVNPAVQPNSPWLQVARQSGARLRTEIELFIEACPGQIVGVTGSNGKSTTAAMIASILCVQWGQSHCRGEQSLSQGNVAGTAKIGTVPCGGHRVFLGGNIGGSLLEQLPEIGPSDWVVLELSSFQLWHFSPKARMPHVAVVTGCTPNHLDWHETFDHYAAAKQRILIGQTTNDIAILNTQDPEVASWSQFVRGRLIVVGESRRHTECAAYAHGTAHGVCGLLLEELPSLSLPGEHNRVNAACAAAAAIGVGCDRQAVQQGLQSFRGLPQRLQWLATVEGRQIYNDSTATTPESTIAALQAMEVPVWLLAGGKNKGCHFGPLAEEIARRARGAAFFGASREDMQRSVAAQSPQLPCTAVETMDEALQWCWQRSRPGEAILLSPACASTDQFRNFRHRGERFDELIATSYSATPALHFRPFPVQFGHGSCPGNKSGGTP